MPLARVVPHERVPVPFAGDEQAMLSAFLDRYRETILWKLDGLSTEQASRRLVPSATTLLGMVKHLAYVERGWFQHNFAGEPVNYPWPEDEPDQDIDFRVESSDTIASVSALYREEIAKSRRIAILSMPMSMQSERSSKSVTGSSCRRKMKRASNMFCGRFMSVARISRMWAR